MNHINQMDQKQSMGAELIQSINLWFEKSLNLQIGNTSLYEKELIKNNLNEMELNHLNNCNILRRDVLNKCTPANEVLLDTSYAASLTTEHDITLFIISLRENNIATITIPKENGNIKNIEHNICGSLAPPQIISDTTKVAQKKVSTEYVSNNNNINNTNNIEISSVAATTVTAVLPNEIEIKTTSVANSQGCDDVADLISELLANEVSSLQERNNNNNNIEPKKRKRKKKYKNRIKKTNKNTTSNKGTTATQINMNKPSQNDHGIIGYVNQRAMSNAEFFAQPSNQMNLAEADRRLRMAGEIT